jgi:hypothetical protein
MSLKIVGRVHISPESDNIIDLFIAGGDLCKSSPSRTMSKWRLLELQVVSANPFPSC